MQQRQIFHETLQVMKHVSLKQKNEAAPEEGRPTCIFHVQL
jgi:hypothetical protein